MLEKPPINKLKQQQIFDELPSLSCEANGSTASQSHSAKFKASQAFDEKEFNPSHQAGFEQTAEQSADKTTEQAHDAKLAGFDLTANNPIIKLKSRSKMTWPVKLLLLALSTLVFVETGLGLWQAFEQSPWLFGFYTIVLGVVVGVASLGFISEWRKLGQLKQVVSTQETGERLALSMQIGEADKFITPLLKRYPEDSASRQYLTHINPEHNDAEKLMLFDTLVLSQRDSEAKKLISRYAAEAALLLSASPLAALDMAIILWRNQKMVTQVAQIYAIDLGYWSRIKLLRSIVANIIYAGSAELITDLGTQVLSLEMAGKLSARVAQGLGGGLLTARLGYQAMSLCRPLVFNQDNKPKLSQLHQSLLSQLKDLSLTSFSQQGPVKQQTDNLQGVKRKGQ
ncbi:TIGR01620 family protein [Shewanella sp. SR44-3]|uniref:TIGR01620 family protein n=1 Tax=Shewanella sp. SR44-3 TaxID=2760936 RepID=UPI0015FE6134|nr:TIGR01620 family protein [Shewanella sp. SR44-3]MBB1270205.1 TIGR01620 family protein [Shewanella sp. SR44-3]